MPQVLDNAPLVDQRLFGSPSHKFHVEFLVNGEWGSAGWFRSIECAREKAYFLMGEGVEVRIRDY